MGVKGYQCGYSWKVGNEKFVCTRPENHAADFHYDERLDQRQDIVDSATLFPKPEPESILTEAARIVDPGGERATTYGGPAASFGRIANLWTEYLRGAKTISDDRRISDRDVANLMILLKVARTTDSYHRDSYVDIAGYARCVERIEDEDGS